VNGEARIPGVLLGLALLLPGEAPSQLVDVTLSSGLGAIVEAQYTADPDWWLSGLHFVDLDGNGALDVFLSAHTGGSVAVLNSGSGAFAVPPGSWPDSEIHLHADLDEDGRVDLSMTHDDGGGRWWRNVSTPGNLGFAPTAILTGGNAARSQLWVDLDGDGFADWLRGAPPGLVVDLGDGAGGFESAAFSLAIPGTGPNDNANFLPGDFDGDGDIDLLAMVGGGYEDTDGRTYFYRHGSGLSFVDATAAAGLPALGTVVKGVGDFDLDGDSDLIAIAGRTMPPVVYDNNGAGQFTLDASAISGVPPQELAYSAWGTAVPADFDNDGVVDILMNGKYYLKLLRGTGGGQFSYANAGWGLIDSCACSIDDGLAFADFDADGDLDLLGYDEIFPVRTIVAYRNDSPARGYLRVRPVGRSGNRAAAGALIRLFEPGTAQLVAREEVAIYCFQAANSYYGRATTERHFGLGNRATVDVEVKFHPSGTVRRVNGVPSGSTIVVDEGLLFADGFASGNFSAWSAVAP
jgi:hypothetical protein